LAWTIRVSEKAVQDLRKLDRQVARRIRGELAEVAGLEDPRSRGKALVGNLAGLWRYRVGDYRVICDIEDEILVVLVVVGVAHRSEAYRRR
jgi:mRNA interferase RelE/StbE